MLNRKERICKHEYSIAVHQPCLLHVTVSYYLLLTNCRSPFLVLLRLLALHPALDIVATLVKSIVVSPQEWYTRVGRVAALYAIKFHLLPTAKERERGEGGGGSRNFSLLVVYFFRNSCTVD